MARKIAHAPQPPLARVTASETWKFRIIEKCRDIVSSIAAASGRESRARNPIISPRLKTGGPGRQLFPAERRVILAHRLRSEAGRFLTVQGSESGYSHLRLDP